MHLHRWSALLWPDLLPSSSASPGPWRPLSTRLTITWLPDNIFKMLSVWLGKVVCLLASGNIQSFFLVIGWVRCADTPPKLNSAPSERSQRIVGFVTPHRAETPCSCFCNIFNTNPARSFEPDVHERRILCTRKTVFNRCYFANHTTRNTTNIYRYLFILKVYI